MVLDLWEGLLLLAAGLVAGAINAAAGGGSLVSFPALLVVGYPPILANVTNNVAVWPGYVGAAWGYRGGLEGQKGRIAPLAAVGAAGALAGVGLILVSSPSAFEGVVPFLVLAACALIALGPLLSRFVGEGVSGDHPGAGALAGQFLAAVYGGYFGAALGVAVLALLGLSFNDPLQRLNALKSVVQLVIGTASAVGFAIFAPVAWDAAAILGAASIVGGHVGARLARRLDDRTLRVGIVVYGVIAAAWLFARG